MAKESYTVPIVHRWTADGEPVVHVDDEPVALEDVVAGRWRNAETAGATLATGTDGAITAEPAETALREPVPERDRARGQGRDDHRRWIGRRLLRRGRRPGCPPERREEVFEPGYSTNERGTGLGLAIVHKIVEAHGWTVRIREGEMGGARFEFGDVDAVQSDT